MALSRAYGPLVVTVISVQPANFAVRSGDEL